MAVDLLEVARCCNERWSSVPAECWMSEFGCTDIHALKDCPMIKAAVVQYPSFDLDSTCPLATFVSCRRCECIGGDDNLQVCGHCTNNCWCEQRCWGDEDYWRSSGEDGVEDPPKFW